RAHARAGPDGAAQDARGNRRDAGQRPAGAQPGRGGLVSGSARATRSSSSRSGRGAEGGGHSVPHRGDVVPRHRGRPRGADGDGDDLAPSRPRPAQEGAGRRAHHMSQRPDENGQLSSLLQALAAPEPSEEVLTGARRRYLEAIASRERRAVFTGLAAAVVGLVVIATLLATTVEPAALVTWLAEATADLARWA